MTSRRSLPAGLPSDAQLDDPPPVAVLPPPTDGIPPHVWATLEAAGEEAAHKLYDLLASPLFDTLPATSKIRLIELGLTRAYGLPVKRSLSVNVDTADPNAVAQALADMHASLPEMGPRRATRTSDGSDYPNTD